MYASGRVAALCNGKGRARADMAEFEFSARLWRNGPTPLVSGFTHAPFWLITSVNIIGARETRISPPMGLLVRSETAVRSGHVFGPFWPYIRNGCTCFVNHSALLSAAAGIIISAGAATTPVHPGSVKSAREHTQEPHAHLSWLP